MHTILNLNRLDSDRNEIFTPTIVRRGRLVTSHSKTSSDQKLQNGAEAALYLFENKAIFEKPLVDDYAYKAMTPSQKVQNCTLDYNTYIVEGEITEETTIESARKNFRVWAVTGWEKKRLGSELARHIKVLLK